MYEIRARIFRKNYLINFKYEQEIIRNGISNQLSHYGTFTEEEQPDVIINICKNMSNHKILKRNPSIHAEVKNGFIVFGQGYKVCFYKNDEKLNIDLVINDSGNYFISFLKKANDMEFLTREERVAEILFEAVLIPSLFFDANKFIVHSSGFERNNRAILIGGTGGSGKTSLEIELCINQDFSFTNDDIAVINKEGFLLPNLAYPKIYAYNVLDNPTLQNRLLYDKSWINKMHWHIKRKFVSPAKVRRRFAFNDSFTFTDREIKLEKYFILSKENVKELTLEKIDAERASQLHLKVMMAEYSQFFNHFYWHEFNSLLDNKEPIISNTKIRERLYENALSVFQNVDNYILRIPLNIKHSEFIQNAVSIILNAD